MKKITLFLIFIILSNLSFGQNLYVQAQHGAFLKDSIKGNNFLHIPFNTEVSILKDTFPPSSVQWFYVTVNQDTGWICKLEIGEQWFPPDSLLLQKGNELIALLQNKESLAKMMNRTWDFYYHEYNRSTGVTEGIKSKLKPIHINQSFFVKVSCDGRGWEFDSTVVRDYTLKFNLATVLHNATEYNIYYYHGDKSFDLTFDNGYDGEYFLIKFKKVGNKYLISEVHYNNEDPG